MVEYQDRLSEAFGALADPTRRAIVSRLRRGPAAIGELAAPFEMSFAAVSKHIQVLERAGLIVREVQGRTHLCSLRSTPLAEAANWLEHYRAFWERRLDALGAHLRRKKQHKHRR